MKCPRCGHDAEKNWKYCPKCGMVLARNGFFSGFFNLDKMFDRMHRQMDDVNKMFDKNFEVFDLRPMFREGKPGRNVSGFTVKISRIGGKEPKVSVRTFGDVDNKAVQKEVKELAQVSGAGSGTVKQPKRVFPSPRYTEEPKTSIRKLESKVVVEIEIPDVKSEEDIQIDELENSVEVKAVAGDKAYFKILTKPADHTVTGKKFEKGRLIIEFS
jgi:HSP20 family molecular chaperone IbpA